MSKQTQNPLPVDLAIGQDRYRPFIGTFLPEACPSCGGTLDSALVGLDEEMLVCVSGCGWEEGDETMAENDFNMD